MDIYEEDYNWYSKEEYKFSFDNGRLTGNILLPIEVNDKIFPVLYLIHGMGTSMEWQKNGIASKLNNWVNEKKIKPVIAVMPTLPLYGKVKYDSDTYLKFIMEDFSKLMENINKMYGNYILNGCENTIIAGASMGGAAALLAGVRYSDKCMHVGGLSPSQQLHIKEGQGWIPQEDNLRFNTDKSAVHFVGYSKCEPKEFEDYAKNYIKCFGNNNFKIEEGITYTNGHSYQTFKEELELFLKLVFVNKE